MNDSDFPLTIRPATDEDSAAVVRLAALDSGDVPAGALLIAETDGQLRAALSLRDGETVADPFHRTIQIVELLVACASQERTHSRTETRWWRRLKSRTGWPARRRTPGRPALA